VRPVPPVLARTVAVSTARLPQTAVVGGTIGPRHNTTALVIAQRPGVVTRLCVRQGQPVRAGQPVAFITYDLERERAARQPVAPVPAPAGQSVAAPPAPAPPATGEPASDDLEFHLQANAPAPAPPADAKASSPVTPAAPAVAKLPLPAPVPLCSPISGVVTRLYVHPGQHLARDFPVVATVMDTRQVELVAQVPAAAAQAVGRRVVLSPTRGGRSVRARVERVTRDQGRELATVVIPNPRGRLQAGAVLSGELRLGPDRVAVMVPWRAVCRDGAQRYVLVEGAQGRVVPRPVLVGGRHGPLVEVRSGLRPGERVLVVGNYRATRRAPG